MRYKDKKEATKSEVLKKAKEISGREPTKEDILNLLFDEDNYFSVYWWDNPWETETTAFQRLNRIWFFPLFILVIAPIQWLLLGKIGFDGRTKIGEIVLKLIGVK